MSVRAVDVRYGHAPTSCRDCGAPVIWAFTPAGKRMPLNHEPKGNGTVMLMRPAEPLQGKLGVLAVTLSGDVLARARKELALLYTSHHIDCPNAVNRRPSRKKAA